MSFKEFLRKNGIIIGIIFYAISISFIIVFATKGNFVFGISGIISFCIGLFFMLLSNTVPKSNQKRIKPTKAMQNLNINDKRICELEEENKKLHKLINNNYKKFNFSVEKYCNLVGYIILSIAILLFLIFLILGTINLIKSSTEDVELVSEVLNILATNQFILSFVFVLSGTVISAVLFALSKIINILNGKKTDK